MPVNVKLLKKVRKLIAEEPRRLRMSTWGFRVPKKNAKSDPLKMLPPCGTVACLAGWTILAGRPSIDRKVRPGISMVGVFMDREEHIPNLAAKLLGLDVDECPFQEINWDSSHVLAWIDRQIDAASK